MKHIVTWSKSAQTQLNDTCAAIKNHSASNARKVRLRIFEATALLSDDPLQYKADPEKKDNDGNFRSFIAFHYKISYWIRESEIVILRLRHTGIHKRDV